MPFTPGFQLAEALDLLAMCANVEDEATSPIPPAPPGWTLVFDSTVIGPFDEKWQLWHSAAGSWAIALRGTVMKAGSIFEDLISILVSAAGAITVGPHPIPYRFAADAAAGVHLGFALGTLLLLKDPEHGILAQLATHGVAPGDVYITGHSQGAAMATLLRSYFEYASDAPVRCSYKTYVFAQPKPGNEHYALDFEARFANAGLAFRVTNSLDWVPQVPFTLELLADINRPNPLSVLTSPSLLMSLLMKLLERVVSEARSLVETHARAHLQVKAAALARKVAPAPAPAATLLASGFDVPVLHSLDFSSAGTEVALVGTPCAEDECHDAFFEHHATTYYKLLQAQIVTASPANAGRLRRGAQQHQ
jgi:hypothetical protein